jgi:hypothetical protein
VGPTFWSKSAATPTRSLRTWRVGITPQERAEWTKGTIEDWVLEGHRLAQTVAYGDLGTENPAPISAAYEKGADAIVEIQLEKAGVNASLK